MRTLVIDASIAVKRVVEDGGTPQAPILRRQAKLIAPNLLAASCANILWKKVQRDDLSKEEAVLAARLLQAAEIVLFTDPSSMEAATRIAIELDHPAYASISVWRSTMAASSLSLISASCANLTRGRQQTFHTRVISLMEAARL